MPKNMRFGVFVYSILMMAASACAIDTATPGGDADEATASNLDTQSSAVSSRSAPFLAINITNRSHVISSVACTPCKDGGGRSGCTIISHTRKAGCMKAGSVAISMDWDDDGNLDEDFCIAPNSTIWHSWGSSNGWKVMPNGGSADDICRLQLDNFGRHAVDVKVERDGSIWRSVIDANSWTPWSPIASEFCAT